MLSINRSELLPYWHKLAKQGGFWGRIAESAMYADEVNLEILVNAFPKLLNNGQASKEQLWMQSLSTSKTARMARLKLVWNS